MVVVAFDRTAPTLASNEAAAHFLESLSLNPSVWVRELPAVATKLSSAASCQRSASSGWAAGGPPAGLSCAPAGGQTADRIRSNRSDEGIALKGRSGTSTVSSGA